MADKKPQVKQGGLGKGLAALIPTGPGAPSRNPRLGDSAADVILGLAPQRDDQGNILSDDASEDTSESGHSKGGLGHGASSGNNSGQSNSSQSGNKRVAGAPTIGGGSPKKRQPKPASIGATYREISIGEIQPNPKQPRTVFDEDELGELVHSIREFGLLQPVVVRPSGNGGFELIMGERRWRASAKAGLATIPAIVRDTKDDSLLRDALLENIHRVQLNPLEEAHAYQQLLEEFDVTQNQLADRIGRSRPQITNTIRLLRLPVEVQRRVAAGVLSSGHARALLGLDDKDVMDKLAQRIVSEGLSVRATEEAVTLIKRNGMPDEPKPKPTQPQSQFFTSAGERLSDRFETKVTVTMGKRKGKMVVEFGDQEDFERIMSLIDGKETQGS